MAAFLQKQIPTLTKAVVRDQIPAAERRSASTSRRSSSSRSRSTRTRGGTSARRSAARARSRS